MARPIVLTACVLLLAAGAAQARLAAGIETIRCDENAQVSEPVAPNPRYERVLFGKVGVPTGRREAYRSQDGSARPYFAKMGFLLRLGSGPVEVAVPARLRSRVSIGWGYGNLHGPATRVRFLGCPLPRQGKPFSDWVAYAGGIEVRSPMCVPLVVRAGKRAETVRLGIGRRCA